MTATAKEARDQCFAIVKAAADVVAPGIRIDWQGKENNTPPPQDAAWIAVTMRHTSTGSRQASVNRVHGKARWRREGTLFVQCFAPYTAGGLERAMELACAMRDAFQSTMSTSGGVWFRDPTAYEVGSEKNWFNANASARFTYDEVK